MKIKTINITARTVLPRQEISKFSYATRSMCNFIIQKSRWIEADTCSLLLINLEHSEVDSSISMWGGRCGVYLKEKNLVEFIDMPSRQQKEQVLQWIERALKVCVEQGVMSEHSRQIGKDAAKLARELGYKHVYKATRPVMSPSKKHKAYVEVTHDTDICVGDIVIVDRKGKELVRSRAFEEKPDELIFRKWLVKPQWRGEIGVILPPDWGYEAPREVSLIRSGRNLFDGDE